MPNQQTCINCGETLILKDGVYLCPNCNTQELEDSQIFLEPPDSSEYVFIECPGATLYEPGTDIVTAGAEFLDNDDPSKGCRIVEHPVYSPTHTKRRRIKKEALGRIRRCQGCQDYTVRMRRPEGPDFFIPSPKHPHRKKLKSVNYRTFV
jgi:hypothetical protein